MNAIEAFGLLVQVLTSDLKTFGFKRKKQSRCFINAWDHGFGMIQFQSSNKSNAGKVLFILNIGIEIRPITLFLGIEADKDQIDHCQWKERVGRKNKESSWWTVQDEFEAIRILPDVRSALNRAVPSLLKMENLFEIEKLWSAGISPGLTDVQREAFLAIVLLELGRKTAALELLETAMARRRGSRNVALLSYCFESLNFGNSRE